MIFLFVISPSILHHHNCYRTCPFSLVSFFAVYGEIHPDLWLTIKPPCAAAAWARWAVLKEYCLSMTSLEQVEASQCDGGRCISMCLMKQDCAAMFL